VRWFKLLSHWEDDPWVQSLEAEYGLEGIARYIRLCCLVAAQMDGSDKCSVTISWDKFKSLTKFYHVKEAVCFMRFCFPHIQFSVILTSGRMVKIEPVRPELITQDGLVRFPSDTNPLTIRTKSAINTLIISIPNLLKYRDETSKKSGRVPAQETRDKRQEIQRIGSSSFQSCKASLLSLPDPVKIVFEAWQAAPGVSHSRRLSGHEGPIRSAIEYLGDPDKVVRVIQRYGHVMVNAEGKYRPVYSWGINDFLSRRGHYNLDRFSRDNWEDEFLAWHTGRQFKTVEQLTEDL